MGGDWNCRAIYSLTLNLPAREIKKKIKSKIKNRDGERRLQVTPGRGSKLAFQTDSQNRLPARMPNTLSGP